jgi:small subunit ribosomal protein S20
MQGDRVGVPKTQSPWCKPLALFYSSIPTIYLDEFFSHRYTTCTFLPQTMPNLKNAKKALRQSIKHAKRNKTIQAEIHSLRIKLRKSLEAKKSDEAIEIVKLVGKKIDKAVNKKILKKNTAARYKSRAQKKVNALKTISA